jgi:hypothetical protein
VIERLIQGAGEAVLLVVYFAAAVVVLRVSAHGLTWLIFGRRGAAAWVWGYWNTLGAVLVAGGMAGMLYGWLALGLSRAWGSLLAGLGLLLASVGLWMLVPV